MNGIKRIRQYDDLLRKNSARSRASRGSNFKKDKMSLPYS
jgi:hypothetical protein